MVIRLIVAQRHSWLQLRYHLFRVISRAMATSGSDHLERTSHTYRQEVISPGEITNISNLSASVKMLKILVKDKEFGFKAGQWIDMFIPGVDTVGGFSMCSSPQMLDLSGELCLAIKNSTHPPAHWVHTKCNVGDMVKLRAGGDFYYDPPSYAKDDILLLAGGVGVNPLYSILQHFVYLHPESSSTAGNPISSRGPRLSFLYSAGSEDELIFKEELTEIAKDCEHVTLKLHSTRTPATDKQCVSEKRIQLQDIQSALERLDKTKTSVYICGPAQFLHSMQSYCLESGLDKTKVFFETWW